MHLVDEQDDVAVVLYLLDDALETVLELAAILRAGDECGDVERHEALVTQHVGHLTICDELGKPLGDGGLAHAGLADKQGVVLRAARENLLDAVDFAFAPDDRVERVLGRELGEIGAELLERGALAGAPARLLRAHRGIGHGRGSAVDELGDRLAYLIALDADVREDLHGDPVALADDAEQQVLGRDVVLAKLQRLAQGALEHALGARGKRDVPRGGRGILVGDFLDLTDDLVVGDVKLV